MWYEKNLLIVLLGEVESNSQISETPDEASARRWREILT